MLSGSCSRLKYTTTIKCITLNKSAKQFFILTHNNSKTLINPFATCNTLLLIVLHLYILCM